MPAPPKPVPTKIDVETRNGVKSMTLVQLKKEVESLIKELDKIQGTDRCIYCGRYKTSDKFYKQPDYAARGESTCICKECAKDIAENVDGNGIAHEVTRDSLIKALLYMNRPFYESLYQECKQMSTTKTSPAVVYFREIHKPIYDGKTFLDSEIIKSRPGQSFNKKPIDRATAISIQKQLQQDKEDTIRMIGYDPFSMEAPDDQPFLYSQLLAMLDSSEDATEDMMRLQSAISIVRSFLQINKLDDALTDAMGNYQTVKDNSSEINKMQDSKLKIQTGVQKLAAESCLSLKNSKSVSKGDSTWTGKLKKIKDLDLRCSEVNGFDLKTCKAMEQVLDMSNQSIIRSLRLDESEYTNMIAEQRDMIHSLEKERDKYKEMSRVLLRENLDVKAYAEKKGVDISSHSKPAIDILTSFDRGPDDD